MPGTLLGPGGRVMGKELPSPSSASEESDARAVQFTQAACALLVLRAGSLGREKWAR